MVNRTALAALLLALAAPSWAVGETALQQAQKLPGGKAFDGGCTGGSCGGAVPACEGEACRINKISNAALSTGGLVVAAAPAEAHALSAEVPAPSLVEDKAGSREKPGFFSRLINSKGFLSSLGGGAMGAGLGFLLGGPAGAVIGGIVGALIGFIMSKIMAK